jgi:hypothetical protein
LRFTSDYRDADLALERHHLEPWWPAATTASPTQSGNQPPSSLRGAKVTTVTGHTVIRIGNKIWRCVTACRNRPVVG